MTDGSLPTTRFELHAREQRWRHAAELCGDDELEWLVWIDHVAHTVTARPAALKSYATDPAALRSVARKLPEQEAHGGPQPPGGAGATSDNDAMLLADLVEREELGPAASMIESAAAAGRRTIVWATISRLAAAQALLGGAQSLEVLEQVSIEGVALASREAASLALDVAIDSSLREGDRAVVVCANFSGRAADAAARVAAVEGGSERLHLATALGELRRVNTTLRKAQRGKSMAAPAMFIQRTEREIAEAFEERERLDKEQREAWIAGLLEEIGDLKRRITEMESRRAWRLVERLARWRGQIGLRGPSPD